MHLTINMMSLSPSHRAMKNAQCSLKIKFRLELAVLNEHRGVFVDFFETLDIPWIILMTFGDFFYNDSDHVK